MPWEDKEIMSLREEFILRLNDNLENISKLCHEYNITRPTAYKWLRRYQAEGILGLEDRSKRPSRMPLRTNSDHTKLILSYRKKFPDWGARKLRQVLINEGYNDLPSEITFHRILLRNDAINAEESEKRKPCIRFERQYPNELWQMDFKDIST